MPIIYLTKDNADKIEAMTAAAPIKHLTKDDHAATIQAAREFKKLFDETIMADVSRVNPTPFEEFIYQTGGKVSQFLARFLNAYDN